MCKWEADSYRKGYMKTIERLQRKQELLCREVDAKAELYMKSHPKVNFPDAWNEIVYRESEFKGRIPATFISISGIQEFSTPRHEDSKFIEYIQNANTIERLNSIENKYRTKKSNVFYTQLSL